VQANQGDPLIEASGGREGGSHVQLPELAIEVGTPGPNRREGRARYFGTLGQGGLRLRLMVQGYSIASRRLDTGHLLLLRHINFAFFLEKY
jgi:hypothetical protein